MRNGLYKVEFETPRGSGAGIIALSDGKLWGGDSSLYYVGSYTEDGGNFSARVRINVHTRTSVIQPVLGVEHANLELHGKAQGDSANMTGSAPEAPGVSFRARLSRLGD
jgi:hypothetical protein